MNADLAQLLVSRDPVAAVTIWEVYTLAHAEVGRRLPEVFWGDSDVLPDDAVFQAQVYAVAGWTWFVVGDTVLAHLYNTLGVTDPAKWLAAEHAVKAFAVEALTALRGVTEDAVRRGDATPPPEGCPALEAAMARFQQTLNQLLARGLRELIQLPPLEPTYESLRKPDESEEETP